MKDFEDFQVSAWLSNGLITDAQEKFVERLHVASGIVSKLLVASATVITTFCTVLVPADATAATISGGHGVVSDISHVEPERKVDQEIVSIENALQSLRAKLSARDFSSQDQELLAIAKQARESANRRNDESIEVWAKALVSSQFL